MTREEAIQYAEKKIDSASYRLEMGYLNNGLRQIVSNEYEFFMQALSALRQQEHFSEVTKKVESLTNAQKIRSMSDEELAEFLTCINPTNCQDCAFSHGWRCQPDRYDYSSFEKCKEGRKRWLQQPAEEDDHIV